MEVFWCPPFRYEVFFSGSSLSFKPSVLTRHKIGPGIKNGGLSDMKVQDFVYGGESWMDTYV